MGAEGAQSLPTPLPPEPPCQVPSSGAMWGQVPGQISLVPLVGGAWNPIQANQRLQVLRRQ